MRARRASKKVKGPKRVPYELIAADSVLGRPIYRQLRELVLAHHDEVADARFAIAWNLSWKPDVDGRVVLGKCKKATDLDRELANYDFIILLRKAFWTSPDVSNEMRAALLDHELCHATVRLDARTDEPVTDERGRKVYRIRKHDVEEFHEIVSRHGIWKSDIEQFARALFNKIQPFQPCDVCRDSPGWAAQTDSAGTSVVRCQCWIAWRERSIAAREFKEGASAQA